MLFEKGGVRSRHGKIIWDDQYHETWPAGDAEEPPAMLDMTQRGRLRAKAFSGRLPYLALLVSISSEWEKYIQ